MSDSNSEQPNVSEGTGTGREPTISFKETVLKEAAAKAAQFQAEFSAYIAKHPVDAVMFIKLLSVCDGRMAEAVVLWDMVDHVQRNGLHAHKDASGADYVAAYGASHFSDRAFRRAVQALTDEGFLDEIPRVRNMTKRFFLNWSVLEEALQNQVDAKLPGLRGLQNDIGS